MKQRLKQTDAVGLRLGLVDPWWDLVGRLPGSAIYNRRRQIVRPLFLSYPHQAGTYLLGVEAGPRTSPLAA